MRDFSFRAGDPLSLILAADARLTKTNYCNDQIWELALQGGDPPALAVITTYGLRARSMRMFPRFIEAGVPISDPEAFAAKPIIRKIFPNALEVEFAPFPGLLVTGEYWVTGSDSLAGRILMKNSSPKFRQVKLEWVAMLYATEGNQSMAPMRIEHVDILAGATDGLKPVVFMTGGVSAHSSPFPALSITVELPPGKYQQFIWCQVAREELVASFVQAREVAARQWEAEFARLILHNSNQIEILTGNEDWNAVFAIAQKSAFNLLHSPSSNLPSISFISTRRTDKGHSLRGDGSDYDQLWNGQTPLEAYYLSGYFLPTEPHLVEGFISNFFTTINEMGEVDLKPGLGGQRSGRLATPVLASLAWKTYQYTANRSFLERLYPHLEKFFFSWFTPNHDRDGDGIPEWDHPMQSGYNDHPLFARWHPGAQGIDITTAESPSLCAFLYRECDSLLKMAHLLSRQSIIPTLKIHAEQLREFVNSAWNPERLTYHYRDREMHNAPDPALLAECVGSCSIDLNIAFSEPVRLVFSIDASSETTRRPQFFIHGSSPSGNHRVEHISADKILWFPGWGTAMTDKLYAEVEFIDVRGLNAEDRLSIQVAGYSAQDVTTLLPLWAGMIAKDQAQFLIENAITATDVYWKPFGLPSCPGAPENPEADICQAVNLPLCSLIGEGMLRYGYRREVAELVNRMMAAIIKVLKKESTFREFYHAETGEGLGERNVLWGFPPIDLFFKTLGVQILTDEKVYVEGFNPFPWSVTLKYKGLTVLRSRDSTQVIFQNGQTVSVDDPRPQTITLE